MRGTVRSIAKAEQLKSKYVPPFLSLSPSVVSKNFIKQ